MNIICLVLQQSACLIHHPVRGVDGHHHLSLLLLNMDSDVQLRPRLRLLVRSQRAELDEADLVIVAAETVLGLPVLLQVSQQLQLQSGEIHDGRVDLGGVTRFQFGRGEISIAL